MDKLLPSTSANNWHNVFYLFILVVIYNNDLKFGTVIILKEVWRSTVLRIYTYVTSYSMYKHLFKPIKFVYTFNILVDIFLEFFDTYITEINAEYVEKHAGAELCQAQDKFSKVVLNYWPSWCFDNFDLLVNFIFW